MLNIVDEIVQIFESRCGYAYLGEPLSQLDHALQTGHLARKAGADDWLVVAALLHDLGHLVTLESIPGEYELDKRHEHIGAAWLARCFGPEVIEPIRLHVTAKRYLCSVDRTYTGELSIASIRSLELQGGPLSPDESAEFEKNLYYDRAVQLRRWDDKAKIPAVEAGTIQQYRNALLSCMKTP